MLHALIQQVRYQLEQTDNCQGVQLFNALGGGTGSGISALLMAHLTDYLVGQTTATHSVVPCTKLSEIITGS